MIVLDFEKWGTRDFFRAPYGAPKIHQKNN